MDTQQLIHTKTKAKSQSHDVVGLLTKPPVGKWDLKWTIGWWSEKPTHE